MTRHIHRESNRTPEETAQLRADRERYLREKKGPEELLAESGYDMFIPIGELLELHELPARLKREREMRGITLTELASRAGIDPSALSKIENGKNTNPTAGTLARIAGALGLTIGSSLLSSSQEQRWRAQA